MTVSIGTGTASQSHESGDQRIDQRHVDAGLGVSVATGGIERVVIGLGNRHGLSLVVDVLMVCDLDTVLVGDLERYEVLAAELGCIERELKVNGAVGLVRDERGLGGNVAVTSVRAYEIGKVCPEYEHLLPIAQALGVARESLCIYSFSNIGEVLAALKSLCEDYGVMHLTSDEAQGPCCLIPTSEFMVQLFSDWLSVTEQVRSGRMSVADMLSWQDRYRQSYSQEDFPRRCSFELKDKRPEASGNAGFSAWLLSKELPALRKQRGILQGDFANLLGISVAKYRSFEQGRQLPDDGFSHASRTHGLLSR